MDYNSDGSDQNELPPNLSFGFGALNDSAIQAPFSDKDNDPRHYKPANLKSKITQLIDDIEREQTPANVPRPLTSISAALQSTRFSSSFRVRGKTSESRTSAQRNSTAQLEAKFEIPNEIQEDHSNRNMKVGCAVVLVVFVFILTLAISLSNSKGSSGSGGSTATSPIEPFPVLKEDEFLISDGSDFLFGIETTKEFQIVDPEGSDIKFLIGCDTTPISCLTVVFDSGYSETLGNCYECEQSSFLTFQDQDIVHVNVDLVDGELQGFFFECSSSSFASGLNGTEVIELEMSFFDGRKVLRGIYGNLLPQDEISSIGFIFALGE